nr:flagellar basal body-associated protein FliL [Bacillus alkalicola]
MIIILLALTLIGALTLVLYTQFFDEASAHEEQTIDDILRLSVETDEIITNLYTNHIIRAQFVIELDSMKARNEFEKRDFQVENLIIQELSDMKESDFRGSDGIRQIEEQLRLRVNEIMQDGEVVNVYMNQRVIQ